VTAAPVDVPTPARDDPPSTTRAGTDALTVAIGGAGAGIVHAFPSTDTCKTAPASRWVGEPASDKLWVTARDGDVVLVVAPRFAAASRVATP
jgi:hypothetical protein